MADTPRDGGERVWRQPDGNPVSCREKLKVLEENIEEISDMCREALEDAVLMGCDEAQVRDVLHGVVDAIGEPFKR